MFLVFGYNKIEELNSIHGNMLVGSPFDSKKRVLEITQDKRTMYDNYEMYDIENKRWYQLRRDNVPCEELIS